MRYLIYNILCFLFAFVFNADASTFASKTDHVGITVIPEYETITENTKNISLIAEINIKPDWHIYWDNPGDSGDPTTLTFYDSPHYTITAATHSAPKKFVLEDIITTYVHRQKLYYKTTFALNDLNNLDNLPFKLVLSYTVCRKNCLPETITLDINLPITDTATQNSSYLPTLLEAENTFPLPLTAQAKINRELLELSLSENIIKACGTPEFVSSHKKQNILADLPKTALDEKNRLIVTFDKGESPKDGKGLLLCNDLTYEVTPDNAPLSATPPTPAKPWLYYLLTAFLAGLILNLMPCVLPILSLKALYLAAHKEKSSVFSALMYLTGVISSFLLLSGALYYLKTVGTELGWGFQLQSPAFNIFLFILFFIIFLSLLDKLPIPALWTDKLNRLSSGRSFLTGFFAVLIACPCTGPFMGGALGYAITQAPFIYFGIFIMLASGYALPYVLIEAFPSLLLKYIPKPGHWMITLKRILSLPIALTCLWLGWVTYNQLKPNISTDIIWEEYNEPTVAEAVNNDAPVFIDFTAKWCLICLLNDKTVLSSDTFKNLVKAKHIRLIKADWTNRDDNIKKALENYNRNSVPLYVYYPPHAKQPQILPQILTEKIIADTFKSNP